MAGEAVRPIAVRTGRMSPRPPWTMRATCCREADRSPYGLSVSMPVLLCSVLCAEDRFRGLASHMATKLIGLPGFSQRITGTGLRDDIDLPT
jgi:hypothetical protein